jgi:hypothetical protein
MKPSITSVVVAAILLAGTIVARAQFTEGGSSSQKARSTHHSGRIHVRMKGQTARLSGTAYSTDTEGFTRLPSVFRNCEEPLPWYCERPTGSLWFGSIATLHHYRRAAPIRVSPEF